MTDRELMQEALNALELFPYMSHKDDYEHVERIIANIRTKLAEPEQGVVPLEKYRKLSALCTRQSIRLMEYENAENNPVAWLYINKIGGRQVSLIEPPKELKQDYYALYMIETKPQLAQRTGNCLLTGICAAEGHRITKEKADQTPVVWMYQDKSTNEVKFQKEMRAFVDHGATYEVPLYASPQPKEVPYDPSENNKDYERGFVDGMQHQMKSSVDVAVNAMANQQKTSGSPIPELVGKFSKFSDGIWREVTDGSAGQPLYTAPPQREWQGLTDEEYQAIRYGWDENGEPNVEYELFDEGEYGMQVNIYVDDFARAIEAKLKEKNT